MGTEACVHRIHSCIEGKCFLYSAWSCSQLTLNSLALKLSELFCFNYSSANCTRKNLESILIHTPYNPYNLYLKPIATEFKYLWLALYV